MEQNAKSDSLDFMDACSVMQFSTQFSEPIAEILSQFPCLLKHMDEKGYAAARLIEANSYQVLRNIKNIEIYNKLEKPYFELEVLDIVELVECVLEAVNAVCSTKIEATLCEGPLLVEGNRDMQIHTLLGVIRNALCYTIDHGSVHISVVENGNLVVTRVSDQGERINPKYYDEIFEPFFSVDPRDDSTEEPGLGLDLAILYRLQQHLGARRPFASRNSVEGNVVAIPLPVLRDTAEICKDKIVSCQSSCLVEDRYSSLYLQLYGFCRFPK